MNNTDAILHQVINDLPNFPRNIIDVWIFPYAKEKGWPPNIQSADNSWKSILLKKDLDYWRNVIWHKETKDILNIPFSSETKKTIQYIALTLESLESKKRIDNIVYALQTCGTFPHPPVFVEEDRELTIADGHHRIFAYHACWRSISRLNIKNYLNAKHTIWVGTPS